MRAKRRFQRAAAIAACAFVALAVAPPLASRGATAQAAGWPGRLHPWFLSMRHAPFSVSSATIPFWASTFSFGGRTYKYTMVGTNPASGQSTTVPTEIIPLKVRFADGTVIDGSNVVTSTVASPIFQPAALPNGDTTQYGDAIQRSNFNVAASGNPNWHVLVGQPTVLPAVTLNVPFYLGKVNVVGGHQVGYINSLWFEWQLLTVLAVLNLDPRSVPIFLDYNTVLYQNTMSNCCVGGYHGLTFTRAGITTYMFAAYMDPGIFTDTFAQDVNALSHEMAEWLNDPFTFNLAPRWSVPAQPQYGCNSALEVGDPLVGVSFDLTLSGMTYHPQDEAFLPWFSRVSPSYVTESALHLPGNVHVAVPSLLTSAGGALPGASRSSFMSRVRTDGA